MSNLLLDETPLIVLPSLAKKLGSVDKAVIVQQIHWLSKQARMGVEHDGHKWVWGTYDQWCEDYFTFWTPAALRKHINYLESIGVLVSEQLNKHNHDRTKYYRVDYRKLNDLLLNDANQDDGDKSSTSNRAGKKERIDGDKSSDSYTKTTYKEVVVVGTEPTSPTIDQLIIQKHESNFGLLSPVIVDMLAEMIDEYSADWVSRAMDVAIKANNRRLNYVEGILKRWKVEGPGSDEKRADDPVNNNPAVMLVAERQKIERVAAYQRLNLDQREAIVAAGITDLEKWAAVITEGRQRGRFLTDVTWMIDWYKNGVPPLPGNRPQNGQLVNQVSTLQRLAEAEKAKPTEAQQMAKLKSMGYQEIDYLAQFRNQKENAQ